MADNEAKLDLTADDKVAKAAIDRLVKQVATLEEQLRTLNDKAKKGAEEATKAVDTWAAGVAKLSAEGKKVHENIAAWDRGMSKLKEQADDLKKHSQHHSEISHWLSEQGRELIGIGVSYLSITKGVEAVVAVVEEWRDKVKELGKEHETLAQNVVKTLHSAGLLKFGPEMEEFIKGGAGGGGTPEQARQAMAGVTAGAPNADVQTVKSLTAEVTRGAPLGYDLAERGTLMGRLHDIDKTKSADDIADLATVLTQKAGKRSGQLTDSNFLKTLRAFTKGGLSLEEAGGIGLSAMQNDQQMRKFASTGELLERDVADFAPKGNPHRLTPEEREDQAFGKLDAAGRVAYLKSHEAFALRHQAFAFNKLPAGQAEEMTAALKAGESGNAFAGELESLNKFHFGRVALGAQEVAQAKAEQSEALGGSRTALTQFEERNEAQARTAMGQVGAKGVTYAAEAGYAAYQNQALISGTVLSGGSVASGQNYQALIELLAKIVENTAGTEKNTKAGSGRGVPVNGHNEGSR